jgi:hypothetical protein
MNDNESVGVPFLSLLPGGRHTAAEKTSRLPLELVRELASSSPVQMSLPFIKPAARAVISVGFDALDFPAFVALVKGVEARRVVDVRISPSFVSRGFSRPGVDVLFQQMGVTYVSATELGNRFVGQPLEPEWAASNRFREYLRGHMELLRTLATWIATGPIVLMSRTARHEESERAILLDEIVRLGTDFDLYLVDAQ